MSRALQEHVVAIVSVFRHDPTFDKSTRSRLEAPEVKPVVEAAVRRCLREPAATRPEDLRQLLKSMKT